MTDIRDVDPLNIEVAADLPTSTDQLLAVFVAADGSRLVGYPYESVRRTSRPHLAAFTADHAVAADTPGCKGDPRGGTITATLPDPATVAGMEWQFANVGRKGGGGLYVVAAPIGGILSPADDASDLPSITLRRGMTLRIRAEVVLDVDQDPPPGTDLSSLPKRAAYVITGA